MKWLLTLVLLLAPQQENPKDLQAVIETSAGTFTIQFYADEAPIHVRKFMDLARQGFYNGTTFHTMVTHGVVQAGDPETKSPAARDRYGTGGLNLGIKQEALNLPIKAGTVAATLQPNRPDSAGSQFFICISDQLQMNGQYSPWAYVVDGMDVLDKISLTELDDKRLAKTRIEIKNITIKRIPPPVPPPFTVETVEQLKQFQVVMETSKGKIVIDVLPDKAPNHVRHFLQLTQSGAYDSSGFHRVVPGFVIQAGDLNTRKDPISPDMRKYIGNIAAEFNDVKHQAGILSMARGEATDSATTSFFIVLADQPSLDGMYTVFAKVAEGMDVVQKIAAVPADNEKPREAIDIYSMKVVRKN